MPKIEKVYELPKLTSPEIDLITFALRRLAETADFKTISIDSQKLLNKVQEHVKGFVQAG